eukprot:TRINITY_DN11150_c0_g1_i2.p2 TRINITY_DN11150_c0_g1~~TRINITY_DN11150_c0_g1_i2.p2  ORF type:complete len:301 (+),score=64.20 TRINITY_DN11150_c0_g1_i2:1416-2318(+)
MSETTMWVGVAEGGLTAREKTDPYTCKIGGLPKFVDCESGAQAKEQMMKKNTCGVCGDPMYLLVQAYCPLGNQDRILYVLCCNDSHCHEKNARVSWRVFSHTMPQQPNDQDAEEEEEDDDTQLSSIPIPDALPWCYPEIALDTFEEPEEAEYTEEEEIKKMESINKEAGSVPDSDLHDIETSGYANMVDKTIAKFQARLQRCPTQVVRWGYSGKPLWISESHQLAKPPPCQECGEPQTFEFQVIPTIVHVVGADKHLKPTASITDDGLDFGTLTIYSCSSLCESPSFREHCFHVQPPPKQ